MGLHDFGFAVARPMLHRLDAERAHRLTIDGLKLMPAAKPRRADPVLAISLFGQSFPNPVGLAAGFDKNGEVPDQMLGLGFGFVEAGTVTPLPQPGNPQPRLFRLVEDEAVINRMGFNNDGHGALLRRLARRRGGGGIVGVNIGANKESKDRIGDYVAGVKAFGGLADYLTINISSPNTPGLRGLQSRGELQDLLGRLNDARRMQGQPVAMLLKIAPDLGDQELEDIAACCLSQVDGVIISNTTLTRPRLASAHGSETGGLSGRPLFGVSTHKLAQFYLLTNGLMPLVGVGGIRDVETAWMKICAGASLVQLYSALVFEGPGLITRIVDGLAAKVKAAGFATVSQAVGSRAAEIGHQSEAGT
jgi:dihydroorotate dehydrogenase